MFTVSVTFLVIRTFVCIIRIPPESIPFLPSRPGHGLSVVRVIPLLRKCSLESPHVGKLVRAIVSTLSPSVCAPPRTSAGGPGRMVSCLGCLIRQCQCLPGLPPHFHYRRPRIAVFIHHLAPYFSDQQAKPGTFWDLPDSCAVISMLLV